MNAFLITFKPRTENPDRGWPVAELERLASRVNSGKDRHERWRFVSRKAAKAGDRVFLLQQGKNGPAILGYGWIAEAPTMTNGSSSALIEFEVIGTPISRPLIDKVKLKGIQGSESLWNTQASGIRLPGTVAAQLELLVAKTSDVSTDETDAETSGYVDAVNDLGTDTPDRARLSVWTYSRDPAVRAEVLQRARGHCELCGLPGFLRSDGTKYLECHHIIALASDGADRLTNVIALCATDHRAAHFSKDAEELEQRMISKLRSCSA